MLGRACSGVSPCSIPPPGKTKYPGRLRERTSSTDNCPPGSHRTGTCQGHQCCAGQKGRRRTLRGAQLARHRVPLSRAHRLTVPARERGYSRPGESFLPPPLFARRFRRTQKKEAVAAEAAPRESKASNAGEPEGSHDPSIAFRARRAACSRSVRRYVPAICALVCLIAERHRFAAGERSRFSAAANFFTHPLLTAGSKKNF